MNLTAMMNNDDVWDLVAKDLRTSGVATVDLSQSLQDLQERSFATARTALEVASTTSNTSIWIPVHADSAHATGFHSAGGDNSMSRYNEHREGFVFSDEQSFEVETVPEFGQSMADWKESLHGISNHVLEAIERQLDIPRGWFQQALGPTRTSSQFHVKRYVMVPNDDLIVVEPRILLPMHTDPSLISVVIHDAKGRNVFARGLEYFCPIEKGWQPVPFHGHGVAVLLVGSVLSYMTGNIFPSVKHRVVQESNNNQRVAATLFVRPQLSAILKVPPSTQLVEIAERKKSKVTFSVWISRVSRNYSKKKATKKTGND